MQSEIERLTAENKQLKDQLQRVTQFFNHGILFEQRNILNSARGYAEVLLKKEIELSEEQIEFFENVLLKNLCQVREIQQMTEDFIRAGISIDDDAEWYKSSDLIDSLYSLDYCRIESLLKFENIIFAEVLLEDSVASRLKISLSGLDLGLFRIAFGFCQLNPEHPLELRVSNNQTQYILELITEFPSDGKRYSEKWQGRYENGFVDHVSKLIFELYGGDLRTEIIDPQIVSIIELPFG